MMTLYDHTNRAEEAKTLADFFGRSFFGKKSRVSVPSTNKALFFIVEDSEEADENRLDQAA